jgi:hypothetical protein
VRVIDLGDATDGTRLEIRFADVFWPEDDPESRIGFQTIGEHLPVPRLENV